MDIMIISYDEGSKKQPLVLVHDKRTLAPAMGALRNGQAHTGCTLLAVAKEAILLLRLPARESFWGAFFQKGPVDGLSGFLLMK